MNRPVMWIKTKCLLKLQAFIRRPLILRKLSSGQATHLLLKMSRPVKKVGTKSKANRFYFCGNHLRCWVDGVAKDPETPDGSGLPQVGYSVWFGHDHPLNVSCRVQAGGGTEEYAHLLALTNALEIAKNLHCKKMEIRSDSNFVRSWARKKLPLLKKNGWKEEDGSEPLYLRELRHLDSALQGIRICFVNVPMHLDVGLKKAFELALAGAEK